MKKKWIQDAIHFGVRTKTWKIMRLCALFLFLFLSQVWAESSYSQQTKLTLKMNNVRVIDVLDEIENNSEFYFLFNQKLVDVERKVNVDVSEKSIDKILTAMFAETDVNHYIQDRLIILTTEKTADASELVFQQQNPITGTVTDNTGEPLPGVTVVVKGTTQGTVTNIDGKYSIDNVPENATLQFSFVGMKTQEIPVGNQTTINVQLEVDAIGIEEVVAVGYGTMKKSDLTGSVGTILSEAIEYKPVTQISQALAGEISGVSVESNSGSPGSTNTSIRIRGMGTFSDAGNDPLVLVDGIPSSLDNLSPSDIKSISVLKDPASASIYGSRAANGVLLVETKRGKKGRMTITYNGYVGFQKPTAFAELVSSGEYAELYNEYSENSDMGTPYSDEEIALYYSQEDPDNYANVNHYKDLFESGSGFQTNHSVGFSGGSENVTYNFSTGYLKQDGLIDQNSYERYNFLLNIDAKIADRLQLSVSTNGDVGTIDAPNIAGTSGTMSSIITSAIRLPVTYPGRKTDGTYGYWGDFHPEADLDSDSFYDREQTNFLGNAKLKWSPIKYFSITGRVGYKKSYYDYTNYHATFEMSPTYTLSPNSLTCTLINSSELVQDLFVEYDRTFNKHKIHAMLGFNQDEFRSETITAYRNDFPNNSLYVLDAGSSSSMENTGTAYEWALQSYIGRINYDYAGKYLVSASARYDGSSRFSTDNRWGFFPSVSAGWRISEEDFFKDKISFVDNLKIRGSWGKLGNQEVGNYPYQSTYELGQDYPYGVGSSIYSGAALTTLANSSITWETTTGVNFGIDASLLNGGLNMEVDLFSKKTSDILYEVSTSSTLGLSTSEENAGEVSNKGFDLKINHNKTIKDFSYGVTLIFSAVKNEVLKLSTVDYDISNGLFVGESLESIYGYVADGLFIDEDDVSSYVDQPVDAEPGYVRYKDISGADGSPDGVVNSSYDRKVIGSKFPKYSYGLNINAAYKNIDFLVQFAGQGGMYRNLSSGYMSTAFTNLATPQKWMADNRWTYENPDRNAKYPKFSTALSGSSGYTSTYWLREASYLKLKNVQIGYNIPSHVLKSARISKLRFYVSGANLFSIDNFYKGWDPEPLSPGGSSFYPITSVFTFGVNASF